MMMASTKEVTTRNEDFANLPGSRRDDIAECIFSGMAFVPIANPIGIMRNQQSTARLESPFADCPRMLVSDMVTDNATRVGEQCDEV
jgi:hypothetical protein